MSEHPWDKTLETMGKTVQVMGVVAGLVISFLSFNQTREREAETRRLELQKPILELRQKLYLEAIKSIGVLSNPGDHTKKELQDADRRFHELYVAELSMVEAPEVEHAMVELAKTIDPHFATLTPGQLAAYNASHAFRDSFVAEWGVRDATKPQ